MTMHGEPGCIAKYFVDNSIVKYYIYALVSPGRKLIKDVLNNLWVILELGERIKGGDRGNVFLGDLAAVGGFDVLE